MEFKSWWLRFLKMIILSLYQNHTFI
jgi:hypothetical protein